MFRVKICGITRPEDGACAVRAGADAIGLNFYARSRRFVEQTRAREIIAALPAGAKRVGVFVNAQAGEIREIVGTLALDYVQLHGDEPPELLCELSDLPVIRAVRLGREGWEPYSAYFERCRQRGAMPAAVLADAFHPQEYGGTGQSSDWSIVRRFHELEIGVPLILAGGLTPDNVSQAVNDSLAFAVDTASGVESAPGFKDAAKMAAFVTAARAALDQVRIG